VFHYVNEVVFCFDGDKAGQAAAEKALHLVLPLLTEGRQVRFAFLPQGEDPDSFVRAHGAKAFQALIKNSTPLSEYFFAMLCQKVPPDSMDNRARLASVAQPLLEQIPAGIFKEMMYEALAQVAISTPQVMRGQKAYRGFYKAKEQKRVKLPPAPAPLSPAYLASAILLRFPAFYSTAVETPFAATLSTPGIEVLNGLLALLQKDPNLLTEELREKLQQNGFELKRLTACESKVAMIPLEGLEAELKGTLNRLGVIGREQLMEKLLQKAKTEGLSEEEKQQLREFLQLRESIG
jgi:DNA primase